MRRRATIAIALVATLAWCLLLFGIGLDDLTDGHAKPGVIFSIVTLSLLIAALVYAVGRVIGPHRVKRFIRR